MTAQLSEDAYAEVRAAITAAGADLSLRRRDPLRPAPGRCLLGSTIVAGDGRRC